MPGFDDQRAAQGCSIPPELLAQIPERRGAIMGGGPQMMTQHESVLAMRVDELRDEIRELRRMLAPDAERGERNLPSPETKPARGRRSRKASAEVE